MGQEISKKDSKKIVKSLNERAETLEDFGRTHGGLSQINTSINKLTGKPETSEEKSKLVKLGTSLILFPEPTPVTDVIGIAMITAGLLEKRYKKRPLTIYDTKKEFAESIKELQKLRQSSVV